MSEALNEQLSALVDNELDSSELPLLLRQLEGSEELTGRLERYYLMRDAMRRELPSVGAVDVAGRVAVELASEPAHSSARRTRRGHALKPAAGLAIAASVAVLAVSLWPAGPATTPQTPSSPSNSVVQLTPQSGAMRVSTGGGGTGAIVDAPQQTSAADGQEWERLDPQVQHWLNGYIVDHSQHAGSAQLGGVINYARIAGQEPGKE